MLPSILDYLNINTLVNAAVKRVLGDNRYLLDLNGFLLEATIPLSLTAGSRLPVRIREFSNDNITLDIILTDEVEPPQEQVQKPKEQYISIRERNATTILQMIEEPITATNIQVVKELLRKNAPVNKETFQTVINILSHNDIKQPPQTGHLVTTTNKPASNIPQDITPKMATTVFLLSRGVIPSPELVTTIVKLNSEYKLDITVNTPNLLNSKINTTITEHLSTNTMEISTKDTSIGNKNTIEQSPQLSPVIKSALDFIRSVSLDMEGTVTEDEFYRTIQTTINKWQFTKQLPDVITNAVNTVLEVSPELVYLDKAIPITEKLLAEPPKSHSNVTNTIMTSQASPEQITINTILNLIDADIATIKGANKTTDVGIPTPIIEQKITNLKELITLLKPEELNILHTKLLGREKKEIEYNTLLSYTKAEKGNILELFDRFSAYRVLNQLSMLRMDGVYITEIPTYIEGKLITIPVRIFHRRTEDQNGQQKNRKHKPQELTITLDIDMTRIGKVRTLISVLHGEEASKRNLKVSFNVRNKKVKDHFDRHREELTQALLSTGYDTTVSTNIADKSTASQNAKADNLIDILDLYSSDRKPYMSVDIRI
ncbi:MAG: hypothetical protein A2W05_02580 [Candidatus Schekmanbacteria bacterium RBG_16_38_10]|uniref:Uncharacterized protein n=1 Tax=Candidatus Schekmanbacteria bacterium RBG_16_38_10 TaxID=1817879 RepID=A0A1F7RZQ8_9BACT|nr:MAG: hypothetical protein A2W05_02580 [Candidatus Schekmanbacteria bacterium RBG_16_38_10]